MNNLEVSASEFLNLLPGPPDISAAWKPFTMHVFDGPLHGTMTFADHVLGLHISGNHRVRLEVDCRAQEGKRVPGGMTLVPAHRLFRFDATAPARFMNLFVPDPFLKRIITEHWEVDPGNVKMLWQPFAQDDVVERVMTALLYRG